jgi:hypothetical protein
MSGSWRRGAGPVLIATVLAATIACSSSNNKATNNVFAPPAVTAANAASTVASVAGTPVRTPAAVTTRSAAATAAAKTATTGAAATGGSAATAKAGSIATAAGAAASAAAASGARLTDCEYSAKFQAALVGFLGSFLDLAGAALGGALSGSPTPAAAVANAQAAQAYDKLNTAIAGVITNLQGFNLPDDLKQVNDRIIAAFQSLSKPLADATAAAKAGDLTKAQSIMDKLNTDFPAVFDQLDKDFPEVTARLNKCA